MNIGTLIKNTSILIQLITFQIQRYKRHWRIISFINQLLTFYYKYNLSISGFKLLFKGRINGMGRASQNVLNLGSMPLQTINSKINYSFDYAITIYSVLSIKI
jgi:ribosomal protein S3